MAFKTFLPKKIFSESKLTKNVSVDSLLLEALADHDDEEYNDSLQDSLAQKKIIYKVDNGIKFPTETFEEYTGNQYLVTFFEKLFQLETKKEGNVRIAYFGDSMTDGDLIVKDFRSYFQEKFGEGFAYAYRFPGWEKVLQAAGRVIRNEDDTGFVILMDERYDKKEYRMLFPEHWHVVSTDHSEEFNEFLIE